MAFSIDVEDARFVKSWVDAIVNLIEEGVLEVGEAGLALKAMDPSQIAMVVFGVPKKAFSKYSVDAPARIGLNFNSLAKIMARTRGKERLTVAVEDNKLLLEFGAEGERRSFRLPLIDIPGGAGKEPKVEHDASLQVNGGALKEVLRDAALISGHITLEGKDGAFSVEAHGDSADLKELIALAGATIKAPARATFPLQYLDDICRACPDAEKISLGLKTNKPVRLSYSIGDASLVYYLAPRIESE